MVRPMHQPAAGAPRGPAEETSHAVARPAAKPATAPLAYALAVMRDAAADVARRDRMALAALAYMHQRLKPGPPKEEQTVFVIRAPRVIESPDECLEIYAPPGQRPSDRYAREGGDPPNFSAEFLEQLKKYRPAHPDPGASSPQAQQPQGAAVSGGQQEKK